MSSWVREDLVDAPLADVERAVLDPATLPRIAERAPMIARAEVVDRRAEARSITRVVRMHAALTPPSFLRLLDGNELSWLETVVWDLDAHRGHFSIAPNLREERRHLFRCEGEYALLPAAAGTLRRVRAEIDARVRIVGPLVERLVATQLDLQLRVEAEVLRELCAR